MFIPQYRAEAIPLYLQVIIPGYVRTAVVYKNLLRLRMQGGSEFSKEGECT